MFRGHVLVVLMLWAVIAPVEADAPRGRTSGGVAYTLPAWFKSSFLHFQDDVVEARQQGKHILVFLHLNDCPYCAKMLKENFTQGPRRDFIQKHFDVIGVNIRGATEVHWIDGKTYTENSLSGHLGAIAIPTIVFLDLDGKKVLQLNGYREPRAFGYVLEYIQEKRYRQESLTAYLDARAKPAVYTLLDHPQFSKVRDFKDYRKPLAVLFEDRHCGECARFHERVLHHPNVLPEMTKFLFVRLDTDSPEPVVGPDGQSRTARQWATELGLSYRPGMVLFDDGREITRMDGRLYHFHFAQMLGYVSGRQYELYPSLPAYSAVRRQQLLEQGVYIDYME